MPMLPTRAMMQCQLAKALRCVCVCGGGGVVLRCTVPAYVVGRLRRQPFGLLLNIVGGHLDRRLRQRLVVGARHRQELVVRYVGDMICRLVTQEATPTSHTHFSVT